MQRRFAPCVYAVLTTNTGSKLAQDAVFCFCAKSNSILDVSWKIVQNEPSTTRKEFEVLGVQGFQYRTDFGYLF